MTFIYMCSCPSKGLFAELPKVGASEGSVELIEAWGSFLEWTRSECSGGCGIHCIVEFNIDILRSAAILTSIS